MLVGRYFCWICPSGHRALLWQEGLVTVLFMSVGLACGGSTLLFLWGLRKAAAA